jgi:hypothetical protein
MTEHLKDDEPGGPAEGTHHTPEDQEELMKSWGFSDHVYEPKGKIKKISPDSSAHEIPIGDIAKKVRDQFDFDNWTVTDDPNVPDNRPTRSQNESHQ